VILAICTFFIALNACVSLFHFFNLSDSIVQPNNPSIAEALADKLAAPLPSTTNTEQESREEIEEE
jgi:hypothetical protein